MYDIPFSRREGVKGGDGVCVVLNWVCGLSWVEMVVAMVVVILAFSLI